MRKVLLLVVAIVLVSSLSFAIEDKFNEYEPVRGPCELGLGLDVVVYEAEGIVSDVGFDSVEVQQKWDASNSEYQGYIVIKANAFRAVKNLLGAK